MNSSMKTKSALEDLLAVMAKLRSPEGCPWDREQDHMTLRQHAVEEVYELMDAIEARDDQEMAEELGDLLLQVVFHCQLARERGAFDFEQVARRITGNLKVKNVDEVWANWEKIKTAEKHGTRHARPSALDGIPKHLPALLRAEKLLKKARKAKLTPATAPRQKARTKFTLARELFELAQAATDRGWSAEELLRGETAKQERAFRRLEKINPGGARLRRSQTISTASQGPTESRPTQR
jgi:uncharacterized protein YabN with tetrapyrrole methylase and pyrophosphatase domain